jgi:hypothetical protein
MLAEDPARRLGTTLRDLGRETVWRLRSAIGTPESLTWPLDSEAAAECTVLWPTRYQWAPGRKWLDPLLRGFRSHVDVRRVEIPQPYPGVAVLRVRVGGRESTVAIDYADRAEVDERCVAEAAVYFKMQFREGGYPFSHVLPGGFVPGDCILYGGLSALRAQREHEEPRFDVYGRFGLDFAREVRSRAVEALSRQNRFSYEGGLVKLRYSRYLREIASARICVDLPGNGDLCFRLVEYLAVGSCIVAVRPRNRLHVPLVDREHVAFVADDLEDLVDVCAFYLENREERERLRTNSRDFFDRYLHRDQLAAYYLSHCIGAAA